MWRIMKLSLCYGFDNFILGLSYKRCLFLIVTGIVLIPSNRKIYYLIMLRTEEYNEKLNFPPVHDPLSQFDN